MASTHPRADLTRAATPALVLAALFVIAILGGLALRYAVSRGPDGAAPDATPIAVSRLPSGLPAAPPVPAPPVEPTVLAQLSRDQAKASNDAVPVLPGPPAAARPFVFAGSAPDRVAARTCLAAAVLYEAGDDRVGEQAVAQVVLNRLRHPAFPKTVCGVVFQGSARVDGTGGCQFTFTCDGALERTPLPAAWKRAEDVADAALAGSVFKPVGLATHYHADYVVPFWRDAMDKIAAVGPHLFYRWRGFWGTPRAFVGRAQPLERIDPRLVPLAGPGQLAMQAQIDTSPIGAEAPEPPPALQEVTVPGIGYGELNGAVIRLADADSGQYVVQFDPEAAPQTFEMLAVRLCAKRADCLVFGWTDVAQMPRALPLMPVGMRGMIFLYRKSSVTGAARALWNCRRVRRSNPAQCIPGTD